MASVKTVAVILVGGPTKGTYLGLPTATETRREGSPSFCNFPRHGFLSCFTYIYAHGGAGAMALFLSVFWVTRSGIDFQCSLGWRAWWTWVVLLPVVGGLALQVPGSDHFLSILPSLYSLLQASQWCTIQFLHAKRYHTYHTMRRRKTERSHRWQFIVCLYNNNNNNNPIPGLLQWRNHMDSNGGMSFMFVWSNRKKNPASLQYMFFSLHAWDLFAPQTAHGLPLSSLLEQVLTLVRPFFLSYFLVVTRYPIWPKCFWLDFMKNGNSRFISRPSQMNWRFLWCKQCPLLCTFSSSEFGRLLQVPNLGLDSCTFTSTPTWIQSSTTGKRNCSCCADGLWFCLMCDWS